MEGGRKGQKEGGMGEWMGGRVDGWMRDGELEGGADAQVEGRMNGRREGRTGSVETVG